MPGAHVTLEEFATSSDPASNHDSKPGMTTHRTTVCGAPVRCAQAGPGNYRTMMPSQDLHAILTRESSRAPKAIQHAGRTGFGGRP
jgi:hypothetical protein